MTEGRPDRAGSQDNESHDRISDRRLPRRGRGIRRNRQARVILGSAEAAIAGKFVEAAMNYADHPTALQLRAMNIIYETTNERGATILMPTSMVDSMNPVVALALAGRQPAPQKPNGPLPLSPNTQKDSVVAAQTAGA
jgi:hypothetical protein